MAKMKIFGDSVVVTSSVKVEDIKTLNKFKSDALVLRKGEKKEPVYAMNMTTGAGAMTRNGVSFSGANEAGLATLTVQLPTGMNTAAKKAYVQDNYGYSLLTLNELEKQVAETLNTVAEDFAAMEDAIEAIEE